MAPETRVPDSRGRTLANGLRLRARPRLGARGPRRDDGTSRDGEDPRPLFEGPGLSARLRALGTGFPFALPRGGRSDAADPRPPRLRVLASPIPARNSPGRLILAARRGGHRPLRRKARPSGRTQSLARVDAGRNRGVPAAGGPATFRPPFGGGGAQGVGPRGGHGRALRGRALARDIRGLPRDGRRAPRVRGQGSVTGAQIGLLLGSCLLYTSDAADDLLCVDLGGRRII